MGILSVVGHIALAVSALAPLQSGTRAQLHLDLLSLTALNSRLFSLTLPTVNAWVPADTGKGKRRNEKLSEEATRETCMYKIHARIEVTVKVRVLAIALLRS